MGSTNGTKLNGIPVVAAQALRDGDQVTVGATTIRFERG
jgi:pSer/pThr/pTyr-binding forkhead associated (FHA) protein